MVVRAVCLIPMITVGFSVMAGWVEAASTRPLRGGLGIKDVTEAPGIWPVDVTAKGEGGGTRYVGCLGAVGTRWILLIWIANT